MIQPQLVLNHLPTCTTEHSAVCDLSTCRFTPRSGAQAAPQSCSFPHCTAPFTDQVLGIQERSSDVLYGLQKHPACAGCAVPDPLQTPQP